VLYIVPGFCAKIPGAEAFEMKHKVNGTVFPTVRYEQMNMIWPKFDGLKSNA